MVKNIVANFVGQFWSILSGFLFIPLYIHYLGFESYSIISFTLIITALMRVLDGGLTATLSREFARNDNSLITKNRIFRTLETSYIIIIIVVILLIILLADFISGHWLILSDINQEKVSYLLKIISFDIGFQMILSFYIGGFLGLEKQVKANVFRIGWGVARNGFVVIIIMVMPTLEAYFLWQTFSTILFTILLKISLDKELGGKNKIIFKPKIERDIFKLIWRFAAGMFLISLVASVNTQLDRIVISKLLPIENLGYYTLAVTLAMGIISIINPISVALLPRFTNFYSLGKINEATKLFNKINLIVAILIFAFALNLAFFSEDLIYIWTGNKMLAANSYYLLPIMASSYAMISMQIIPYNIAIANGYTKLNNILGILSLFITLPGYWVAVKYYGAIGAAVVFCLVQTLTTIIYIYIINKKFINEGLNQLFFKQIIAPFIIALIIAFAFYSLPFHKINNKIILLSFIGFSTLTTLIGTVLLLLPKKERKELMNFNFKSLMQKHNI